MSAWRKALRKACEDRCVICGGAITPEENSYDHFVPRAMSQKSNSKYRVGIVFQAHKSCNGARGHSLPSQEMIARAASIIADLPREFFADALQNISDVEREQTAILESIADLKRAVRKEIG